MAHPRSSPSSVPTQRLAGPALAVLAAAAAALVLSFPAGSEQLADLMHAAPPAVVVPVVIAGVILLLLLNGFLSRLARNGGRLGAQGWDWGGDWGAGEGSEVVVVTGGQCAGTSSEMARSIMC